MALTKTEMAMAARLLAMAADEFDNHGCNDWMLPATPENVAFARDVERDAVYPYPAEPQDGQICLCDWMVMSYLADKLAAEAGIENEGR